MKHVPCLLFLVIGLILLGCQYDEKGKADNGYKKGYEKGWKDATTYIDQKIADLKEERSFKEFEIELKVLTLESQFNTEKSNTFRKFLEINRDKAVFDLSDPGGFRRIDTDLGLPLFLSIADVTPYMDGYKIKLKIGNPNHATLKEMTLSLDWWLEAYFEDYLFDVDEESEEVQTLKNSKSKTQRLLTSIEEGKWNTVELIVPSMDARDAKGFRVMLDASVVALNS